MKSLIIDSLKTVYAFYVKSVSFLFTKSKKKQQIVYLLSFPNNNHGFIETLNKEYDVIVCYTKQVAYEASRLADKGIETWCQNKVIGLFKTIQLISQSKIVIADNYFPLLSDIILDDRREIIQLWHATGAIKQFGLEEKSTLNRSKTDHNRFKRVYQSFTRYVVGSKVMGKVFQNSYGTTADKILYTGFPRTDYLVNSETVTSSNQQVVYLPTYRKDNMPRLVPDMLALRKQIPNNVELFIKVHPTTEIIDEKKLSIVEGIKIIKKEQSADDILLKADCLITDYSSVAFDYALINPKGKLIFYWFDEEQYNQETGIQDIFKETLPYDVCQTIEEVAEAVKSNAEDLSAFNQVWNTYNDGHAQERLLEWIKEKMDGK